MRQLIVLLFAYFSNAFHASREFVVSEDSLWEFQTSTDRHGNVHYVLLQNSNCTFSYDDSLPNGPSKWSQSCGTAWATCGSGQKQSPTNIIPEAGHHRTSSSFDDEYDKSAAGNVLDNHHTVQANVLAGHPEILRGPFQSDYQLLQYHYHAPSEHTINGHRFPLEIHLVHQSLSDPTKLAVIGYWFLPSYDAFSVALDQLIEGSKEIEETHQDQVNRTLKLHRALVPERTSSDYYQYEGSLTTPPCTENVSWYVMATPLYASYSQIKYLAKILPPNARPIQSPNGRTLYHYSPDETQTNDDYY